MTDHGDHPYHGGVLREDGDLALAPGLELRYTPQKPQDGGLKTGDQQPSLLVPHHGAAIGREAKTLSPFDRGSGEGPTALRGPARSGNATAEAAVARFEKRRMRVPFDMRGM
ncbi:hypothetical protein [Nocardiopsis sp. LDBS1602]|uniref:hypothetical protein n=1 Tax=Nocardiopsis sp. LDBS1602 TaxID=3109597 RepID=UPI002DB74DDE|nr:hypothetical protein [Nocardiopsis sp. LDBS1602]MEC3891706.1 hypothetical protein [Nocardiopsis sp. LDBS1602]